MTVRKPEKGNSPALYYIDGDAASLNPNETESTGQGMWSDQTRGVGHYAQFLMERTRTDENDSRHKNAGAAGQESTRLPAAGQKPTLIDTLEKFLSLGGDQTGVLQPTSDRKAEVAGRRVAHELTRRAYDAPKKGTLWGWQVAAYMWTKAISAGCIILPMAAGLFGWAQPSLATQVVAAIVSLLFLGLTGALLAADLDQPLRFVYVLLRPQWRSWLVRGAYIITAFGAALVFRLWTAAFWSGSPAWLDALLVVLAAATAMYTALLFAQAKGRDFWQSPLLGLHMLVHAVMAGTAVFLLAVPFTSNEAWRHFVVVTAIVSIVFKLVSDALELGTTHATTDAARTAKAITRGQFRRLYWGYTVLLGCVLPVALLALTIWVAPIAGLAMLTGIYVAEHIWVRAPQEVPLS